MGPEPASSKSRGSRYRSSEALQPSNHRAAGDAMERGSQRGESGKSKSEKDGGAESGRGVKRRQHGGGGGDSGGGQGGTSGSMSSSAHRSSKRWRGDTHDVLDAVIQADRWDGGATDAPTKENAFPSDNKSKHGESEARNTDGISAKRINAQLSKEGGGDPADKVSRKQKVSKASLGSDGGSRAITVMDLQETNVSIIDSNIRIKNKVSYRREAMLEVGEPEHEKSGEETAKNAVESSRSRRRWDRDGHRGGAEDAEDAHARGNVGREESHDRDRKKEKSSGKDRDRERDRERDAETRIPNGRRSAEGGRDHAAEVDGRLEISDELESSNDFKIQEELRNIELEKELENRIRRRREESGDRDRWRDDDRERDGKRHSDSRERDERAREERLRSRRDRERHTDRYESRQHREGSKASEGRPREDRYYESDREYRSHREERYHVARSKDVEDQVRSDKNRDQDHRDRKGRDSVAGYEAERRASREKGPKEEQSDREKSYPAAVYVESSDGVRSDHRNKRVRESDGEGHGPDRDHSRQRGRPGDADSMAGNETIHDERPRRREDREAEGRLESSRGSPRETDGMRGRGKSNSWRNDSAASEMGGDGHSSPRHDARGSPSSNRLDYMSSPQLDDQRSPLYHSQRSPSHMDRSSGAPRGKTGHGAWFESGNSGPQKRSQGSGSLVIDRRDRPKRNPSSEEDAKAGMFRGNRGTDEGREGSLSPHRLNEQHLPATQSKPPLHGQESFPRGMGGSRGMMEGRSDRGGWRGPPPAFDGGALDHHGPDDLSPRDRSDRVRRMPMNRPPGSPMIRSQGPQMSSLNAPPLAPLPPPPPFRPGIDNPAVLGPLGGGFDDTGGGREQGRGDRKGPHRRGDHPGGMGPGDGWRGVNMGNWNSRNQGLHPGNGFPPFPHQFGHPPVGGGGFPGMGQQFPGPPMFPGGGRPPMDMGFGGGRFLGPGGHMGEGGDGYLGPGRGAGWHGPGEVDDGRGPPLLGLGDGWDGPGPHADERLRHGRMEWDRVGHMGVRGWERDREREMWEARRDGGPPDFMPHRSPMDPPPQNQPFPSPGSGWGVIPRDGQVPNDLKPRPERQSFDIELKRKPDGGGLPKPKVIKPTGRGAVSTNEGRLSKYATATMQSVLSQLDISPELAGPELYAQYRALLPASASGKQSALEEEDIISEPIDKDLILEADPEGEALISCPNLLAKLLPPLPDGVFQEALMLYRKPETENRVLKSSRGCFVLPFDPSTIKMPSISLSLNRHKPSKVKDVPYHGVEQLLDPLKVNILDAAFGEEFVKPNDIVMAVEQRQGGLELEAAERNEIEGEATQDEFISSHVEVAEYSDREFEPEMDDILEDDALKEMQVGGPLLETLVDPAEEVKELVENMVVYKESIDPVRSLAHSNLTVTDNNWQVMDAPKNESALIDMGNQGDNALAETEHQGDSMVVEADQVDNVVVEAYPGDNMVVVADQGDNVVVVADRGDNVVVQAYQVDKVVVEGDQRDVVLEAYHLDSLVVRADQVDDPVIEAYQADSFVVRAHQLDNVVEEAEGDSNVVEEAGQDSNVVEEADQDSNVIEQADQDHKVVEEAHQVHIVVEEADRVEKILEEAHQFENVVEEADRVEHIVEEAGRIEHVVEEADRVDTVAEGVDQVDIAIEEADQVDNTVDEVDQLDNEVGEADQVDNVVGESDQLGSVPAEADQINIVIGEADQVDDIPAGADQVDSMVGEADQVDDVPAEADLGENVNSFVVSKGSVSDDNNDEPEQNNAVAEEVRQLALATVGMEVIQVSETSTEEVMKPQIVQFPGEIPGLPPKVHVSEELVIETAEVINEENLAITVGTGEEDSIQGALPSLESKDDEQVEDIEEFGVLATNCEGNGPGLKQHLSETGAAETIQNHLPREDLTPVFENHMRTETSKKMKEIVENFPAPEEPANEEPQPEALPRLRKRRASTRLLAQQAVQAQAPPQQESSGGVVERGSVEVKKQGTKGKTRTSQRRSKHRGSTH